MSGPDQDKDAALGTPPLDTTQTDESAAPPLEGETQERAAPQSYIDPSVALEIQVAELEAELEKVKDRHLRSLAEAENTRRRSQRDRDEAQKYGGVKLARDLLPVYDNMRRALQSATEDQRAAAGDFFAGIELTERELLNAFTKHQILQIMPEIGEKFDVSKHQAMFEAPIPGATDGTIIEVIQAGFVCHDRLVRAAMVGVAKGGAAAAPADSEDAPEASS